MDTLTMPRLGETVTEGKVLKWLKKEGETVERDEMIVEISTDKVDTEVPSPQAGRIENIMVAEGETCEVGTELVSIAQAEEVAGAPAMAGAKPEEPSARTGEAAGVVTPIVRKLARERGLDISKIVGSGRGGRVTKKDVAGYLAAEESKARPEVKLQEIKEAPPAAVSKRAAGEREEVVPLGNMRKVIAERMVNSVQNAAHVTAMVEVDMEKVVNLRKVHREEVLERHGFKLTYLPFLCRVVVEALGRWERLNAELDGDNLIIKRYVNLGIAVSVPDGLIVPVMKDAENLSILGLARSIGKLAEKARSGRLSPDDVHGGSFTITAPGSFGSIMQTPIINPPEVAILSFDAIVKKPVVVGDAIAIHHVANLSLSYDHRVNDGALAARFLTDVKTRLEAADFGDELLD